MGAGTISLADQTISVKEQKKLMPVFAPDHCDIPDLTWKSSDTRVVTVDKNGVVIGKQGGTATITVTSASDKNLSTTATITVIP